mmetsp:Transcript_23600/g.48859  ORF Transcript_23600/g.48859 Transcript_23600/m.48859 type:complete len:734 (+) Transcript_23600:661-2862(+)
MTCSRFICVANIYDFICCTISQLPVIIAGNKMDLFSQMSAAAASDEQTLARSRQQIVSILQRFKFVRQCIKCSAKNLLNVDEVFLKAQQAVLYPITPLYDLNEGRIAPDCRRAFTRIFRMYDKDNDGLLSNAEINTFQNDAFNVPLVERDLAGWKKVVSKNNPTTDAVIREGKFTVAGFLAIFDVFISQNRLEVPWRILRTFGYDDDLNLEIPDSVTWPLSSDGVSFDHPSWSLSLSSRKFLTTIFHQFDSDKDGVLSTEDILAIFSVMPEPSLPPWHPLRAKEVFRGCFSLPMLDPLDVSSRSTSPSPPSTNDSSPGPGPVDPLSASEITICSGTSLPSVDISKRSSNTDSSSGRLPAVGTLPQPLVFLDWMGYWHMINAISPSRTRAELFRLGHVEAKSVSGRKKKSKKKAALAPAADYSSVMIPSKEIRALVLGSRGCGKTALLNALRFSMDDAVVDVNPLDTQRTTKPGSCCVHVRTKKKDTSPKKATIGDIESNSDGKEEFVTHLILTEVPQSGGRRAEQVKAELEDNCDLVVLTFDCGSQSSLLHAQDLEESMLTDDMPRVYVATKADDNDTLVGDSSPVAIARRHCANSDLEPPLLTSAAASMLGGTDAASVRQRDNVLEHLALCALEDDPDNGIARLRSTPHAEQKRREAARRKRIMWLGGFVCVSVAVALGVGALLGSRKDDKSTGSAKSERSLSVGWFKGLFGGGGNTGSTSDGATVASTSFE